MRVRPSRIANISAVKMPADRPSAASTFTVLSTDAPSGERSLELLRVTDRREEQGDGQKSQAGKIAERRHRGRAGAAAVLLPAPPDRQQSPELDRFNWR